MRLWRSWILFLLFWLLKHVFSILLLWRLVDTNPKVKFILFNLGPVKLALAVWREADQLLSKHLLLLLLVGESCWVNLLLLELLLLKLVDLRL